ncbi:hypothetical protein PT285_11005 [Lactobacillus sp. ESL0791]|uniref:hypothetical protein n=1 Tax=Lactobacillus sp. ESL0791 TaxID=2983234 RepID=UPI0023F8E66C|nr:hypothetical protein [Lactobacillus sp. ESL0791]MDF7639929.1 hypothetical protein [Lactobacillus sp. ESL0791]
MTETTNTAANAAGNSVTEPENMIVIYKSTDDEPCTPFLAFAPIKTSWPLVAEAPDMTKLKNPKYSWPTHIWVESDGAAQGQLIAQLQKTIATQTQTISDVKQDQTSTQTTLTAIQDTQTKQTTAIGQVVELVSNLVANQKKSATTDGGNA